MRKKLLILITTAALLGLASCGTDNYGKKTTKSSVSAVVSRTV